MRVANAITAGMQANKERDLAIGGAIWNYWITLIREGK